MFTKAVFAAYRLRWLREKINKPKVALYYNRKLIIHEQEKQK